METISADILANFTGKIETRQTVQNNGDFE